MFHVKHCLCYYPLPQFRVMNPISPRFISESNVSRETFELAGTIFEDNRDQFQLLMDRWLWWNRSVNLFSKNTDTNSLEHHIFHSLLLVVPSERTNRSPVIDAGTGGGLPGLPMAIAMPETGFVLVDKVQKKCLAVRDIIRTLGLNNIVVLHSDLARISIDQSFRVVSKHAFPVKDLLSALKNKEWNEVAMLKGKDVLCELDKEMLAQYRFSFRHFDPAMGSFYKDRGVLLIHKNFDNTLMP